MKNKVAAIQLRSEKGSVEKNRLHAVEKVKEAAAAGAKLIALPELWVTGYGIGTELFRELGETPDGETVTMFRQMARELSVVLIIPFPERGKSPMILGEEEAGESIFISTAVIDSDGELKGVYRKSMLWGAERGTFSPGPIEYPIFNTSIGKISVLICYDIEFPEPARLAALRGADLLVVPSVWSVEAQHRWDIQLPARALDNGMYVLGVNTVGEGACGKSKFLGPDGRLKAEASLTGEEIIYGEINPEILSTVRDTIPYLRDYPLELTPGGKVKTGKIKGA
ncbi:nitrilase-related carbon-nitrogen hydrolase [Evansella tamaricis]|uniref:Nitrilase n=1 Tax=Evansella tamaricis TaxID=2069301 RepID=A0ABS6JMK3_9BACI|nr:nitrilase [Evansella tamaricis]